MGIAETAADKKRGHLIARAYGLRARTHGAGDGQHARTTYMNDSLDSRAARGIMLWKFVTFSTTTRTILQIAQHDVHTRVDGYRKFFVTRSSFFPHV